MIVQAVPAALMIALSTLLGIMALLLCKLRPSVSLPENPGSLKGLASILSSTLSHKAQLLQSGNLRTRELRQQLLGTKYNMIASPKTMISLEETENYNNDFVNSFKIHWWRPQILRWYLKVLILFFPAAIILSLEFIQRYSDRHSGFIDLHSSDIGTISASKYIPTMLVLLVATLFGALEFSVCTIPSKCEKRAYQIVLDIASNVCSVLKASKRQRQCT